MAILGSGAQGRSDLIEGNQGSSGFQPPLLTNGVLPSPAAAVSNLSSPFVHEEWRPIPSTGGAYEANSLGQIRDARSGEPRPQRTRKRDGYVAVDVRYGGRRHTRTVNTLVCEAFHGERPSPQHQAAHQNGVRDDNRAPNLLWATPVENASHRRGHGTLFFGERNPQSKLTASKVVQIRQRRRAGEGLARLADAFGVKWQTIEKIVKGQRWPHVGGPIETPRNDQAAFAMDAG